MFEHNCVIYAMHGQYMLHVESALDNLNLNETENLNYAELKLRKVHCITNVALQA